MNGFLKIGTILCWAIAIGLEYVAQKWQQRKKLLNIVAACMFALALFGEYVSYRFDSTELAAMQTQIDAVGISETKLILAKDAERQDFAVPDVPLEGKIDL